MAKKVPPEGDTINGIFVPGGTQIGYGAWPIFRNKKIWGDDANAFRPERWLGGENIQEQELALELIFAAGRYQCLGKNVALMELNKVFVEVCLSASASWLLIDCLLMLIFWQLLRHFEFSVVDPSRPWNSMCMGVFFTIGDVVGSYEKRAAALSPYNNNCVTTVMPLRFSI